MSRGICDPGYCYHHNGPFFSSQMIAMTTSSSMSVNPRLVMCCTLLRVCVCVDRCTHGRRARPTGRHRHVRIGSRGHRHRVALRVCGQSGAEGLRRYLFGRVGQVGQ